jgi:hypothetical protein
MNQKNMAIQDIESNILETEEEDDKVQNTIHFNN